MKFGFFKRKRKSPTKFIEGIKNPELESAYMKYPLGKIIDISLEREKGSVVFDWKKESMNYLKYPGKSYSQIHTHPNASPYPSGRDLAVFLRESNKKVKTMIIAQTDEKTGKVLGYGFYTKTKLTPQVLRLIHTW